MKNPTFSRVKIYCHSKVNYPDIFFKVFHNIEKKITAVISKLPWNLITAVNCLITQAPGNKTVSSKSSSMSTIKSPSSL
jgi:hypothetical protein